MNVLNIPDIERELKNMAVRALLPPTVTWLNTVARNYILNLDTNAESCLPGEFEPYTGGKNRIEVPEETKIPAWASQQLKEGARIDLFKSVQPRRRELWKDLEVIIDWMNTFSPDDPSIHRMDRVSFQQARTAAREWRTKIDENPWLHIKDSPAVFKDFGNGMRWVKLTTALHLTREGKLMQHCVGSGGYTASMRNQSSEFYSLRDKQNEPHITIEVRVTGNLRQITQMKGKQNRKAVAAYQPYLKKLIAETGWPVVGDFGNVDS